MKILSLTLIFGISILTATVTNTAVLIIDEEVTMRVDADFVNSGTMDIHGTAEFTKDITTDKRLDFFENSTIALTGEEDQHYNNNANETYIDELSADLNEYCSIYEIESACNNAGNVNDLIELPKCAWSDLDICQVNQESTKFYFYNAIIEGGGNKYLYSEQPSNTSLLLFGEMNLENGNVYGGIDHASSNEIVLHPRGDAQIIETEENLIYAYIIGKKSVEGSINENLFGIGLDVEVIINEPSLIKIDRFYPSQTGNGFMYNGLYGDSTNHTLDRIYLLHIESIDSTIYLGSLTFNYDESEIDATIVEENLDIIYLTMNNLNLPTLDGIQPLGGLVDTDLNNIAVDDAESLQNILYHNNYTPDVHEYFLFLTFGQIGCVLDGALSEYTFGEAINTEAGAYYGDDECQYHFQKPLHEGSNLISFFGAQDDMSLSNMLSSIENIIGVMGEGTGAINIDGTWFGSLTYISQDVGYWLQLSEDDTLDFIGTAAQPNTEICLHGGNNLISYNLYFPALIEDSLPDDVESCLYAMAGEGMANLNTDNGWVGSLDRFEPWRGYWLVNDCNEICFEFEDNDYVLPRDVTAEADIPKELAFTQSSTQAFYFIEDIEGAKDGDFVVAFNGETIVGSAPYTGTYSTIPVMGNDGNKYSASYAEEGDTIDLFLWRKAEGIFNLYTTNLHFEEMGFNVLGVLSQAHLAPESFAIHSAFPNPFNPSTNIKFDLPEYSNVLLEVYDINGRIIKELYDGIMDAGYHSIVWNAQQSSSGIYFIKLRAGDFVNTQKVMLVK